MEKMKERMMYTFPFLSPFSFFLFIDNPYEVAEKFIVEEKIDAKFLGDIAEFILKNRDQKPITIGQSVPTSNHTSVLLFFEISLYEF